MTLLDEFQKLHGKKGCKSKRDELLKKMTNEELDKLIAECPNHTGKIVYVSYKRK